MISKTITLSIVVPVFNEENRIHNLDKILYFFSKKNYSYEIIIVDDGSSDNTLRIVKNKCRHLPNVRILHKKRNHGKGYAVRSGILTANGEIILFMDLDLSTPLKSVDVFMKSIKKHHILIGSRRIKGSIIVKHQPVAREFMGATFTLVSRILLGVNINDFTCGFKMFDKKVASKIFSLSRINRWGFDCEILYIAKKHGYSAKEIPVKWLNDEKSRVNFPNDIFNSVSDLVKIRFNSLMGYYS